MPLQYIFFKCVTEVLKNQSGFQMQSSPNVSRRPQELGGNVGQDTITELPPCQRELKGE